MLTTIIVTVILGAIIGVLARLVLPGKQNISILTTVILGIIGALVGSWLWTGVFNKGDTSGIDWIALIMGVIVAALLIVGYERLIAGRTSTRVDDTTHAARSLSHHGNGAALRVWPWPIGRYRRRETHRTGVVHTAPLASGGRSSVALETAEGTPAAAHHRAHDAERSGACRTPRRRRVSSVGRRAQGRGGQVAALTRCGEALHGVTGRKQCHRVGARRAERDLFAARADELHRSACVATALLELDFPALAFDDVVVKVDIVLGLIAVGEVVRVAPRGQPSMTTDSESLSEAREATLSARWCASSSMRPASQSSAAFFLRARTSSMVRRVETCLLEVVQLGVDKAERVRGGDARPPGRQRPPSVTDTWSCCPSLPGYAEQFDRRRTDCPTVGLCTEAVSGGSRGPPPHAVCPKRRHDRARGNNGTARTLLKAWPLRP